MWDSTNWEEERDDIIEKKKKGCECGGECLVCSCGQNKESVCNLSTT